MSAIKLVQGDNLPIIRMTLKHPDGTAMDLSDGTTSVVVYFRAAGTTAVLSTLACAKVNGCAAGEVSFSFPGQTLDVPAGPYEGEIEISFGALKHTVYDVLKFFVREQFN